SYTVRTKVCTHSEAMRGAASDAAGYTTRPELDRRGRPSLVRRVTSCVPPFGERRLYVVNSAERPPNSARYPYASGEMPPLLSGRRDVAARMMGGFPPETRPLPIMREVNESVPARCFATSCCQMGFSSARVDRLIRFRTSRGTSFKP